MSEENLKITTVKKEKDPIRVEAGKRLALISKASKEKKMRDRIELENKKKIDDNSWNINYGFLFGVVGMITTIVSIYYKRKDDKRQEKLANDKAKEETTSEKHVLIQKNKKYNLDSFE